MCKHLQVSRSGYYDWLGRKPTVRQIVNTELIARIKEIHAQRDKTYGMPRIHAVLRSMGESVNKKRLGRRYDLFAHLARLHLFGGCD